MLGHPSYGKAMMTQRRSIHQGRVLRDIREMRGITQRQLAQALGRSQSFVSKTEAGDRALKADELFLYAEALGFEPEQLVSMIGLAISEAEATARMRQPVTLPEDDRSDHPSARTSP